MTTFGQSRMNSALQNFNAKLQQFEENKLMIQNEMFNGMFFPLTESPQLGEEQFTSNFSNNLLDSLHDQKSEESLEDIISSHSSDDSLQEVEVN